MRLSPRWFVFLLPALLLSGCGTGSNKLHVKGRVTRNGAPLRFESRADLGLGRLVVSFMPVGEGDHVAGGLQSAVVNQEDGTFTVDGTDGKGILPGRYRIYIYQYDPMPTVDKLKGEFAEGKSLIERDVTGGEEINIDVSKKTG